MLWRGTLKDFTQRSPPNSPSTADKVSWDKPPLQCSHLHRLLINVPISALGPGAAPLGLSLGGLGDWLLRWLWALSSCHGKTFIFLLSLLLPALTVKALSQGGTEGDSISATERLTLGTNHGFSLPFSVQSDIIIANIIKRRPL